MAALRWLLALLAAARGDVLDCGQFRVHQVQHGSMANYQYLLESAGGAVLIDAAWDIGAITRYAKDHALEIKAALYTHAHADHVGGNIRSSPIQGVKELLATLPALQESSAPKRVSVYIGENDLQDAAKAATVPASSWAAVRDGKVLRPFGEGPESPAIVAVDTPGHTRGGISFLVRARGSTRCPDGALLTGDTLFKSSVGRTDLPGGNRDELLQSLGRLAGLPPGTIVFPGHSYGIEVGERPHSSIGDERRSNSWVKAATQRGAMPIPLPKAAMPTFAESHDTEL